MGHPTSTVYPVHTFKAVKELNIQYNYISQINRHSQQLLKKEEVTDLVLLGPTVALHQPTTGALQLL